MSRHSSHERVGTGADNTEVLEIIREEQCSPALSSVDMNAALKGAAPENNPVCIECQCKHEQEVVKTEIDPQEIEKIILDRETTLRNEFQGDLDKERNDLRDKFDFILHNEQIRASYMLREAHRERQEKISALQTQLECKNLAGLMYVMCTERRKSKLQKLRLIEEYTGYIHALQQILTEGQELILKLSRGYKTAARVDHEWREKMRKVVKEFQAYVYHFCGGPPETNQFIFDLPELLRTEAPIYDNPAEDPIQQEEEEEEEAVPIQDPDEEKPWWELIEGDCRPFVMFGDMAEFKPPQRREVLKTVKAAKTAPQKWKDYVFNEMFVRADCSNADAIKDEYPNRIPSAPKWECQGIQTDWLPSKTSLASPRDRITATSIDVRGNMGSILKIITSNVGHPENKANLLAARDSMEIASTTKLKERHTKHSDASKVKINVGNRVASMMDQLDREEIDESDELVVKKEKKRESHADDVDDESLSLLGSIHNDSLQVIPSHKPEKDHKINYEKVCPMEKCQRMQMDSFVRTLPPYMRASPFTHFEQTYENYEICSPDQLEILKQRIEEKKKREAAHDEAHEEGPLDEWSADVEGVGVQTSDISLPPCTCRVPSPTPVSSAGRIFNMEDLFPIKQTLNEIRKECFYDGGIEFDRFKVIGQDSQDSINEAPKDDFKKTRLYEIKKILKQHPSLCEIFQANTRC